MKALVLAGGFPQIDLLIKLRKRKIYTVLVDYNERPIAYEFADAFYRISTLDYEAVKELAVKEEVDFIITVCTDQALLTVAKVSEELGLPSYIDYQTALSVTNKVYMKKKLAMYNVPTAKFEIIDSEDDKKSWTLSYPIIVKPVDCNSSKGVKKVNTDQELSKAMLEALNYSRTHSAIIEEFIEGRELSVDVWVSDGKSYVLDITESEKIKNSNKFVIFRTWHNYCCSKVVLKKIEEIVQQIARAFNIVNAPMLVQLLCNGDDIYVVEFSARTGGGVKHISIKKQSGFDVIEATVDLVLGRKVNINIRNAGKKYEVDEYIYCKPGVYEHLEGFDELKEKGVIDEFYVFKSPGSVFESIESSGDRVAGFTISDKDIEHLKQKHVIVNETVKVIAKNGEDIMNHELLMDFMV